MWVRRPLGPWPRMDDTPRPEDRGFVGRHLGHFRFDIRHGEFAIGIDPPQDVRTMIGYEFPCLNYEPLRKHLLPSPGHKCGPPKDIQVQGERVLRAHMKVEVRLHGDAYLRPRQVGKESTCRCASAADCHRPIFALNGLCGGLEVIDVAARAIIDDTRYATVRTFRKGICNRVLFDCDCPRIVLSIGSTSLS